MTETERDTEIARIKADKSIPLPMRARQIEAVLDEFNSFGAGNLGRKKEQIMSTATSAELEQRALDGGSVSPEELANARATEAAARDLAELAKRRQAEIDRKAREQQAEAESKPIHDQAAALAPQTEINAAIAMIFQGVKQYFEAGDRYNANADQLRRNASAVARISPTAKTGITVSTDILVVGGHQITPFDAGEQRLLVRVQEAIAQATEARL